LDDARNGPFPARGRQARVDPRSRPEYDYGLARSSALTLARRKPERLAAITVVAGLVARIAGAGLASDTGQRLKVAGPGGESFGQVLALGRAQCAPKVFQ